MKIVKTISLTVLMLLLIFVQNTYGQRYWNTAAKFAGTTSSYIAVNPYSGLANLTGSFTVECWFNAEQGGGCLFGKTGIRLLLDPSGSGVRARLQTNGNTKFYSRAASPMSLNKWYHLACTYDATGSGSMIFYVNGQNDTSRTGTGLGPNIGTDSLFIGTGFGDFKGMIDDVRIWNRALSASEISQNFRIPYVGAINNLPNFGTGMVLSASLENTYSGPGGIYFYDGYNQFYNRGAASVILGNAPSVTDAVNSSASFDGTGDYIRMIHNADIDLTGPMTVEAWVYPINAVTGVTQYLVKKGNDYGIYLDGTGKVRFVFSAVGSSTQVLPSGQWSHLAATCSQTGSAKLYINGIYESGGNAGSQPVPGSDSLFIGANNYSSQYFNGNIDAVKISNWEKTQDEIKNDLFKLIEWGNKPIPPRSTVSLNFDFFNYSSTNIGGYYNFRGDSKFAFGNDVPVSPLLGLNFLNFPNGFYQKSTFRRIPEIGTAGFMRVDSINIPDATTINDVNLLIDLNHTNNSDLDIKLVAPNGDSVLVYHQNYGINSQSDHILTVFDDDADSSLNNGRFVDFGPKIKPSNSLNSVFTGDNAQGVWRLKITDFNNGNTGMVYLWGIQINNTPAIGIKNISSEVPGKFKLEQNYPNPFNPVTNIKFSIPKAGFVKMNVYDITGRLVKKLVNQNITPGIYTVDFDGSNLASGVYFYKLEASDSPSSHSTSFTDTKKMILVK